MVDETLQGTIDDIGNPLDLLEDNISPIARLVAMGRLHGYVTMTDVLSFFPSAEQNVEQLEEAFAALINAETRWFAACAEPHWASIDDAPVL